MSDGETYIVPEEAPEPQVKPKRKYTMSEKALKTRLENLAKGRAVRMANIEAKRKEMMSNVVIDDGDSDRSLSESSEDSRRERKPKKKEKKKPKKKESRRRKHSSSEESSASESSRSPTPKPKKKPKAKPKPKPKKDSRAKDASEKIKKTLDKMVEKPSRTTNKIYVNTQPVVASKPRSNALKDQEQKFVGLFNH